MSGLIVPLAIDHVDVAKYAETLLIVYYVLIFARILMSWIPRMPYNRILSAVLGFVTDVTDPYLNLFRRFIPPLRVGPGALDLSPMIAIFVLVIVGGIASGAIRGS
jgi:YggT family protein